MTDDEVRQVRVVAEEVRSALETCGPESGLPGLKHFPSDSCADAVLLLGARFDDLGLGPFDAVGGEFGEVAAAGRRTHAWLERDGLIVDITADQFSGSNPPVLVTRERRWHRLFHETNRGVADFRRYGPQASAELGEVYACLQQMLDG